VSVFDGFKEGSTDGVLVGTSDGNGLVDGTFVILVPPIPLKPKINVFGDPGFSSLQPIFIGGYPNDTTSAPTCAMAVLAAALFSAAP